MAKLNLIKRRHQAFATLEAHWRFLIETFEGGPEWLMLDNDGVCANIFRFYKEGENEYKQRVARAYRDNISRDVVEIWSSHVFKVPITRDQDKAPPAVVDFWKRATKGKDAVAIDDFMREASDKSGACSPIYLVVDMPAAPKLPEGQVLTQADAQVLKLNPYAYIVYPNEALDFGLDDDDEFTWFLLREYKRNDEDPWESDGKVEERFRLWTRTSWHLYREKRENAPAGEPAYELVEEGEHHLGRVPIVQLCHKKGKDRYRGIGLLEEIAYKDRAIANNESRLDEILGHQTFSQLFLPDAGLIASTDKKSGEKRKKMVEMGVKSIVLFNDKAQHPPMFLAPDAAQATLILTAIDRLRAQIYEDALLDTEGGQQKAGAKTATEAAFDFEKLNSALADKAKSLEAAERAVIELVCLWTKTSYNPGDVESWVQYPRKFQVKALVDELAEALQAKQLGDWGATFWKLYLTRLVKKMLPDVSDEELEAITDEIAQNHQLASLLSFGQMTEQAMRDAETRQLGAGVTGGGGDTQEEEHEE